MLTAIGPAGRLFALRHTARWAGDQTAAGVADGFTAMRHTGDFRCDRLAAAVAETDLGAGAADTAAYGCRCDARALTADVRASAAVTAGAAVLLIGLIGGCGIDTFGSTDDLIRSALALSATAEIRCAADAAHAVAILAANDAGATKCGCNRPFVAEESGDCTDRGGPTGLEQ